MGYCLMEGIFLVNPQWSSDGTYQVVARCVIETFGPLVQYVQRIVRVGDCPAVVAQWQSTGGSSQRCPGFDSQ